MPKKEGGPEPHVQLPIGKITHADHPDETPIYRVPPNLGKSVLDDASNLGRTREDEAKLAIGETPTQPSEADQ